VFGGFQPGTQEPALIGTFQPLTWHHIKASVDLAAHTIAVSIDHARPVLVEMQWQHREGGRNYDFEAFAFGGGNWLPILQQAL
jgi:hypothetical protein